MYRLWGPSRWLCQCLAADCSKRGHVARGGPYSILIITPSIQTGFQPLNLIITVPMNPKDPLHGIALERIVTDLVDAYGWDELGYLININCFNNNPSIKSSLKFLRRTPWARKKVEDLYIVFLEETRGFGVMTQSHDVGAAP